jgi:hypothetical protein
LGHCRTFNAYCYFTAFGKFFCFYFFPFQLGFRYRKMHKLICFGVVGCIFLSIYFDPTHRSGMFKFSNRRCFCWQFLCFRSDQITRCEPQLFPNLHGIQLSFRPYSCTLCAIMIVLGTACSAALILGKAVQQPYKLFLPNFILNC